MSYSINGITIAGMELTMAWGVLPASANIHGVGGSFIQPMTEVVLNLGSTVFNGVVTDCQEIEQDGRSFKIEIADNRIMLSWDTVYCYFNGTEVIEDDPATPGIDRKKRFWHILPDDWHAQTKTYTDEAYNTGEILDFIFSANTINYSWSLSSHERFEFVILNVDALTGKKLSNILQEILEKIGLQVTLEGANTLSFSVKGEGTAPVPSLLNSDNRADGVAIGADTMVRVVGDRNLYQDLPIALERDWVAHFELYWFEPDWLRRIKSLFSITDDGEAAAFGREVTLRDYVNQAGLPAYADYGIWGEVSRMEIPAWIYINDIVYKSYRIPRAYTLNNIPLDSLELKEGLLVDVDWTEGGELVYPETRQYYPDSKGFCLVQGMPLTLLDPSSQDSISTEILEDARDKWQPNNKFRLDTKNKSIIFEDPIFRPRNGGDALYLNPNEDVSEAPQDIVVPNADFVVDYAEVVASLNFEAERYAGWYGSGVRSSPLQVSAVCYHALYELNAWKEEVLYADGFGADDKAEEAADSFLNGNDLIQSGHFTRYGTTGTSLNGTISRITTSLKFSSGGAGEGISEFIEFSRERGGRVFEAEKDLERKQRSKDLFPGQMELKEEVRLIRRQVKLSKDAKRQTDLKFENLNDTTKKVAGNPDCSTSYVFADSAFSYPVGMPAFVDDDLELSSSSKRFAGCITTANLPAVEGSKIPVATQGNMPCRVKGPVLVGDSIGVNDGDDYAKSSGNKKIGVTLQAYSGTETVVLRIRVATTGSTESHPYKGYDASSGVAPKVRVQSGTHNGIVPTIEGTPINETIGDPPGPPLLTVGEDDECVYVQLDLNGSFAITSASIHSSTISTVPTSTDSTAYQILFFIAVTVTDTSASVVCTDNVSGSQGYNRCGDIDLFALV